MKYKFILKSEEDTKKMAAELLPYLKNKIVFLNGGIGAGKTTFTGYFVNECGMDNETYSPTFSIENRYEIPGSLLIHFDLYRINSEEELDMIGFYETLNENATIFIEWADKFNIEKYIKNHITMTFSVENDGSRIVTVD